MSKEKNIKKWTTIYRALGNQNRLRVLQLLKQRNAMSVSELSEELKISFKNTSRNLNILTNLDLVIFQGRNGKVYYSLNPAIPDEIKKILNITLF